MSRREPNHLRRTITVICKECGAEYLAVSARRTICDDDDCHRARNARHKRAQMARLRRARA